VRWFADRGHIEDNSEPSFSITERKANFVI
jgi:hypothetical protein